MGKLKVPIILLVIIVVIYVASVGLGLSKKDVSVDNWSKKLDDMSSGFVSKEKIQPEEITLAGNSDSRCLLELVAGEPMLTQPKGVMCSVSIAGNKEVAVRSLAMTGQSGNNIKIGFVGKKGSKGEPAAAPFNNKDLSKLAKPLKIMAGGGTLTVNCAHPEQCKLVLGERAPPGRTLGTTQPPLLRIPPSRIERILPTPVQ